MYAQEFGDVGPIHTGFQVDGLAEIFEEFVVDLDLVGVEVEVLDGDDDGGVGFDAGVGGSDGQAPGARGAGERGGE